MLDRLIEKEDYTICVANQSLQVSTSQLLVCLESKSYREYTEYKEYTFSFQELHSFIKERQNLLLQTPHIHFEENTEHLSVQLGEDYYLRIKSLDWFVYSSWVALQ